MKTHETPAQGEAPELNDLHLRPRAAETISLQIPVEALASLRKIAVYREMSVHALLKLYVGQGLRQDIARLLFDESSPQRRLRGVDEPPVADEDVVDDVDAEDFPCPHELLRYAQVLLGVGSPDG